jgi:hypothetical protein
MNSWVRSLSLLFALALVACSRSGDLSGDVFVTMKSGDVKRAADVEVSLVSATGEFDDAWKKAAEDYKRDHGVAVASSLDRQDLGC